MITQQTLPAPPIDRREILRYARAGTPSPELEALLDGKEVRATNIGHTQRGGETCQYDRSLCTKLGSLAVDALFEGKSGEMVTIYNAVPQTVSLEKVLGSGATGETSKGGSHNVDPNGFVVKTARNIGISFGD